MYVLCFCFFFVVVVVVVVFHFSLQLCRECTFTDYYSWTWEREKESLGRKRLDKYIKP